MVYQYLSFLDWIDINKIDWEKYGHNSNAARYFRTNRDDIYWNKKYITFNLLLDTIGDEVCENPDEDLEFKLLFALPSGFTSSFLMDNIVSFPLAEMLCGKHAICILAYYLENFSPVDTIDHWFFLSRNQWAIRLLELNPDKINWATLCLNRHSRAIDILEKNPDKIDWNMLSGNPYAIHLLEKNPDKIKWSFLSRNPGAIHILEKNQDKIIWRFLSANPAAISLLEKNQDKIDWEWLSANVNAMHLLKENRDKIHWDMFSRNPSINKICTDYGAIKTRMDILREELMKKAMHPARLRKWIEMGGNIDDF
jgi:hypothetical protein